MIGAAPPGSYAPAQDQQSAYAPAQDQQSAYAPAQDQQAAYAPAPDQQGSYPTHSGLNPAAAAAVAALSQLTQFAGTMDAAERAMQERQWHEKGGGFGHPHQQQQPPPHMMQHGPYPGHHNSFGLEPHFHALWSVLNRSGIWCAHGWSWENLVWSSLKEVYSLFAISGIRLGLLNPNIDSGELIREPQSCPSTGFLFTSGSCCVGFFAENRLVGLHSEVVEEGAVGRTEVVADLATAHQDKMVVDALSEGGDAWVGVAGGDLHLILQLQHQHPHIHIQNLDLSWVNHQRCSQDQHQNQLRHHDNLPSGKRHKKTLQRYEEIQKHKKLESQSQAMATNQAENVRGGEEIKAATDNGPPKDSAPADVLAGASTDVNKTEPDLQNQVAEQSEMAKVDTNEAPIRKRQMDRFDNQRHPAKRGKMTKFGRGGKRPRPSEPVRRSESPKEQPTRYCALCNIMCDTQAVFECHLQGKKHQSRAQRFPVPQVGYVAMGYHAPSTRNAQPADSKPQGPPEEGSGNHQAQQAVSGTQAQEHSDPQGQEVTPKSEGKGDVMIKHEGGDTVIAEHKGQDVVSETLATQDNSGATTEHADNVYMPVEDILPAPEFGVPLADNILVPGLDVKSEGDGSINEEPTSHE
ncbi:hypothetical protein MRB53_025507 [Persea americana]|uniref:Uncharacterized protein n=1 Tax=Persea americana TaxID=3435 RepID=A0ACC2LFE5_PERAE|nr:hypothetical protein MRB53_025507 [Persea americana]